MKRVSVYFFLIVSLVCFNKVLLAQYEISLPYECGFEDAEDIENWVLNAGEEGPLCEDQWIIGSLDARIDYNSLYISCDDGQTITYGVMKPNYVMAYRPFVVAKGDLDAAYCSVSISFDWKGGGDEGSLLNCYLLPFDFIADEDKDSLFSNSDRAILPVELNKPAMKLYGREDWTSVSIVDSIEYGRTYYLAFIWQNNNVDVSLSELSICIDNIQIAEVACPMPKNLQVEYTCDTLNVAWEGVNEMYEFEYRISGLKEWQKCSLLEEREFVFTDIEEGAYDFRVRGVCGKTKSAWLTATDVVVYCPDRHCFDYLNLDREGVTCLAGNVDGILSLTKADENGVRGNSIDYGSRDIRSRHTVNWRKEQYDLQTGNKLRTIPEGSLASVRLGNWEGGSKEGIVYDYEVDTSKASFLLIKYAIVLQYTGHKLSESPYFAVRIKDENGQIIDSRCGDLEIVLGDRDWHIDEICVWKDWTSVGWDISEYHGKNIKIELITSDCMHGAHFGYAYFTIDCMNVGIKRTILEEKGLVELEAPEGFRYIWTKRSEPDKVLSTERIFMLLYGDTAIYDCQVEFVDMDGCGFILSASAEELEPYADFVYEWTPRNCENYIHFRSTSSVVNVDGEKREGCEIYRWYLNGNLVSKDADFEYQFDNEGGEFDVRLETGIFNDENVDDTIIVINVPQIGAYVDTIYETICESDYMNDFASMPESGIYVDSLVSVAGCDSIIVLDLTVLPTVDVDTMITINEGEQLEFAGEIYTEAGIYHIDRVLDTVCQNITLCLIVETALEDVNAKDLVVAPNPIGVDGIAVVEYTWSFEEQDGLRVEIINSLGQRVDVFEPKLYPIVLSRIGVAGVYYVRITTGMGGVYVGRLIVEGK